jgi:peroxiredoxin
MTEPGPAVEVGERAPGFRLRHTFEQSIDLAETLERGPVVLVFYVFDFGGY